MQPELHCPRRSRFAPKCKLRLQLKADSSERIVEEGRGYVKEQFYVECKRKPGSCQEDDQDCSGLSCKTEVFEFG